MEEWRDIPGCEGFYQASDQGRIRSVARVIYVLNPFGELGERRFRSKILKASPAKNGYRIVTFTRPGEKRRYEYVHRLVALTFIGPCPEGKEVCHKDGVRVNNQLDNLRYDTRSNNALDRHLHGTMNQTRGEEHYFAKLTVEDVKWIRRHSGVYTHRQMAFMFGVGHGTIGNVIRRVQWRHV